MVWLRIGTPAALTPVAATPDAAGPVDAPPSASPVATVPSDSPLPSSSASASPSTSPSASASPSPSPSSKPTPSTTPTAKPSKPPTPRPSQSPKPKPKPTPTASKPSGPSGVFIGTKETNPYGAVQVTMTVKNGVITQITATYPTDGDSGTINKRAVPVLRKEALAAQSANIDSVSNATYTSTGYKASLQSALDKAGM